jgi:diaminohydroxyphosphoribosylaminopyrimidine deaminase/5-amino-6-(5-phosphoribosylamino)uracil reductase
MQRALSLAERGRFTVSPNPMVGCVIVRDDVVIGEGFHRRAGEAHAEIEALRSCENARGATMFVTLEPCSHHGRTPPCADAVIASGVARVVIAMEDPHEVVNGRGIAALRAAGIDVTVGVLESEARRLNEKFVWSVMQKLPFVLVKAGMTLDGKLATIARESQWITSEAAREAGLRLREEYDAIVVGSGTVKSDNPRLTRRLNLAGDATRWTRVVLDGDGEVPPHAQLLNDEGRTILFTSAPSRYSASPNLEIVRVGRTLRSGARLRRAACARDPLGDNRRRRARALGSDPPRPLAEDAALHRAAARRRRGSTRALQWRRHPAVDRRGPVSV